MKFKHTARFCFTAFWMDFATSMLIVALPYSIMGHGGDSMSLGAATALRGIAYGVSCLLLGRLSDLCNRKILMAASVFFIILSFLLIASASTLKGLYIAMAVWMVALGPFWPSVFSWLGDSHDIRQLGRVSNSFNLSWSLGGILGGMLAGWLFTRIGGGIFILAVSPVILAWLSLGFYSCPHRSPPKNTERAPAPRGSRRTLAAGLLAALSAASLGGLITGVFPLLGVTLSIDAKIFGFLVASAGLGRTGIFLAGLRWSTVLRDWRVVFGSQAAAALLVAGIASRPALWWLIPTFLVTGVSLGICYYRGIYTVLESTGSRGFKSGMFEATLLSGIMLGGFLGGYLANTYGLLAPYPAIAGISGFLVLIQCVLIASIDRPGAKNRLSSRLDMDYRCADNR